MDPALVSQLAHLDRALLALIEERARVVAALARSSGGARPSPSIDDLLRRCAGSIRPGDARALFAAIDATCRRAAVSEGEAAP